MCLPQPFFSPCALPFHLPCRFHLPGWSLVTSQPGAPPVCPTHLSFTPQICAVLDYFSPRQLLSVSSLSAEMYILCRSWAGVSLLGASPSVSADSGVLVPREKLARGFPKGGLLISWYCSFLLSEDLDFPSLPCALVLAAGEQLLLACLGFF